MARKLSNGGTYRKKIDTATPPWLTLEHRREIHQIYCEAKGLTRLSRMRGGKPRTYSVDHIVPLRGKNVWGLHVPWNLRVLPKDQNSRRHRYPQEPLTPMRLDLTTRRLIAAVGARP